jgi:hypothetical protein
MNQKRVAAAAFSLLTLLAGWSSAADKPNFSGSWKLDTEKSDYGRIQPPQNYERTITHHDPDLKIVTTQTGPQGPITIELSYTTDGKESVNKIRGTDVKITAHWDKEALLVESKRTVQGAELKQDEKWTLSPDGRTLTIVNHFNSSQGPIVITIVLVKQ